MKLERRPYDPFKHNRLLLFLNAILANVIFSLLVFTFVSLGATSNAVVGASAFIGACATALLLGKDPPKKP